MEIVLVRHGQPEWVRDGLNVEDPPLTELGHRQAARMAAALAAEPIDEILVSPLLRARQTAAPLLARLGREAETAGWLREIGDPAWHGTPAQFSQDAYQELMARPSLERWTGLEGGENVRAFADRIALGVDGFLADRGVVRVDGDLPVWKAADAGVDAGLDRRVVIVAHAGTNSMALGHLLGVEPVPWQWERFQLLHTSITRLETFELGDGHAFGMTRLGNAEHLPDDERTR